MRITIESIHKPRYLSKKTRCHLKHSKKTLNLLQTKNQRRLVKNTGVTEHLITTFAAEETLPYVSFKNDVLYHMHTISWFLSR